MLKLRTLNGPSIGRERAHVEVVTKSHEGSNTPNRQTLAVRASDGAEDLLLSSVGVPGVSGCSTCLGRRV